MQWLGLPAGHSLKHSGLFDFPTMNSGTFAPLAEIATIRVTLSLLFICFTPQKPVESLET
jgi:hypothetical protein